MFTQASGEYNIEGYQKTPSTVFADGDAVTTTAGLLVKANAATTRENIVGIIQRAVLATDADYASQSVVPVLVTQDSNEEFIAPVLTGSATQAMVNTSYNLHANGQGIDVTATTLGIFKITAVLSATLVKGRFNSSL